MGYRLMPEAHTHQQLQLDRVLHESPRTRIVRAHRNSGDAVVVKVVAGGAADGGEARIRQEYQLLRSAAGPGVVEVLELAELAGRRAIVMREVEGARSLASWAAEHTLSATQVVTLAIALVTTLARLHRVGLVHKDINPSNILVDPESLQPTLIDFSCAGRFKRTTATLAGTSAIEGTLAYLAPEQSGRLNQPIDYRADYYALGCTLYELLTGTPPFGRGDGSSHKLVYAHLAEQPMDPTARAPGVLPALSSIVLKLIAKSPADRYQGSRGLLRDLDTVKVALKHSTRLVGFVPAAVDPSERFEVSARFYGRVTQREVLHNSLRKAQAGAVQVALLRGAPGSGKSALVKELLVDLERCNGWFAQGQCASGGQPAPYTPVLFALAQLLPVLATSEPERVLTLFERASRRVAELACVLVELLPQARWFFPDVKSLPVAQDAERQGRVKEVLRRFIQSIAYEDSPLLFVVDEVASWDSASLELMHELITDSHTSHLLIALTLRSDAKPPDHVAEWLAALEQQPQLYTRIEVPEFTAEELLQLIQDSLDGIPCEELSNLVYDKTLGNPLFSTQFLSELVDAGALWLAEDVAAVGSASEDLDTGSRSSRAWVWRWDLERARSLPSSDNVMDLLTTKLHRMPSATLSLLAQASYVGDSFRVETLAQIAGLSEERVFTELRDAVNEGYLVEDNSLGDEGAWRIGYRFSHPLFRSAGASLEQANSSRVRALQVMVEEYLRAPSPVRVEQLAEQVSSVRVDDVPAAQRSDVARVLFDAGQLAMTGGAPSLAVSHYGSALDWLPQAGDEAQRFECELRLGAAEYLAGHTVSSSTRLERLRSRATDSKSRARVALVLIRHACAEVRFEWALNCGLEQLGELGIALRADTPAPQMLLEFLWLRVRLTEQRIERLLTQAPAEGELLALKLELLVATVPAAYTLGKKPLMALCAVRTIELMLRHGPSGAGAQLLPMFGLLQLLAFRDAGRARLYGRAGVALLERHGNQTQLGFGLFAFNFLVGASTTPPSEMLLELARGVRVSVQAGDVLHRNMSTMVRTQVELFCGSPLRNLVITLERIGKDFNSDTGAFVLQSRRVQLKVLHALGVHIEETGLGDWDEAELEEHVDFGLFSTQVHRWFTALVCHDWPEAEAAFRALSALSGADGTYVSMVASGLLGLYASFSLTFPNVTRVERGQATAWLKQSRKQLSWWATSVPVFGQAWHAAVNACGQAARAQTGREKERVLDLLGAAHRAARSAENFFLAGWVAEFAARWASASGEGQDGRYFAVLSYSDYDHWGADAPLQRLRAEFSESWFMPTPQLGAAAGARLFANPSLTPVAGLDAQTVLEAARALGNTTQLDRLYPIVLSTLMEISGASSAYLFLGADELKLVAAKPPGSDVVCGSALEQLQHVPRQLAERVKQSRAPILRNADSGDVELLGEPISAKTPARSLLVAPLLRDGRILGVYHLENTLVSGVFDGVRAELTETLGKQAAAALQNAILLDELAAHERQIRERNQQLTVALGKAEVAAAARDLFLQNMSHELRTPLNGVVASAEMLRESVLTAAQRDLVETVAMSGETLSLAVESTLDLARLQGGTAVLNVQPFKLSAELQRLVEYYTERCADRALTFQAHLPPHSDAFVIGDAQVLYRSLSHLLNNAVKFTSVGSVKLRCAWQGSPGHERFVATVTDTGCGIESRQAALLFEPFAQGDASMTKRHGGLGVGLAIVAGFAALYKGSVRVSSRSQAEEPAQHGTVAVFEVPLPVATAVPVSPGVVRSKPTMLVRQRVLVVDDNIVNQKVLCRLLDQLGVETVVASNGAEAVERVVEADPFIAVLMDCQMPVMDGFEATNRIRALCDDHKARTPIIAVTANAVEGARQACLDAGMDGYVAKPVRSAVLTDRFAQIGITLCKKPRLTRGATSTAGPNQGEPGADQPA